MIGKQKSKQNEICKLYLFILNSCLRVFATVLGNSCCQALQIFIGITSELTMLSLKQITQVLIFNLLERLKEQVKKKIIEAQKANIHFHFVSPFGETVTVPARR